MFRKFLGAAVVGAAMIAAMPVRAAYLIDVSGQFTNTYAVGPYATALKNAAPLSDKPTYQMQFSLDENSGHSDNTGTVSTYNISPTLFKINGVSFSNIFPTFSEIISTPNNHKVNFGIGGYNGNITGYLQFTANLANSVAGTSFSGNLLDYSNAQMFANFTSPLISGGNANVQYAHFGSQIGITQIAAPAPGDTPAPDGAVPEPATWAMMIVGLGAVGATMRGKARRRVRAKIA